MPIWRVGMLPKLRNGEWPTIFFLSDGKLPTLFFDGWKVADSIPELKLKL